MERFNPRQKRIELSGPEKAFLFPDTFNPRELRYSDRGRHLLFRPDKYRSILHRSQKRATLCPNELELLKADIQTVRPMIEKVLTSIDNALARSHSDEKRLRALQREYRGWIVVTAAVLLPDKPVNQNHYQ